MTVPQQPIVWLKSQRSQDEGACVELGNNGAVRDSKNPDGPVVPVNIAGLVAAMKAWPADDRMIN